MSDNRTEKSLSVNDETLDDLKRIYPHKISDAERIRSAISDALEAADRHLATPAVDNETIESLTDEGGSVEAIVRVRIDANGDSEDGED